MYCPQCRDEYRAGFVECSDCHVPLTDHLPPEVPADEQPYQGDLDVLIRTACRGPLAIGLARGLLEEAQIPFFAMDQNTAASQEGGNCMGWWDVRVSRDREAEAREILHSVEEMK